MNTGSTSRRASRPAFSTAHQQAPWDRHRHGLRVTVHRVHDRHSGAKPRSVAAPAPPPPRPRRPPGRTRCPRSPCGGRHPAAHAITSYCARRCWLLWFLTFDKPETLSDNDVRPPRSRTHPRIGQKSPIFAPGSCRGTGKRTRSHPALGRKGRHAKGFGPLSCGHRFRKPLRISRMTKSSRRPRPRKARDGPIYQ